MSTKSKPKTRARSSESGKFVNKKFAANHKATTEEEAIKRTYPQAWKAFKETKEYKDTLTSIIKSFTIQEKYAMNIIENIFAAGYRAASN